MTKKAAGVFFRSLRAATGTEYGMVLALIAIVAIGAVTVTGTSVSGIFERNASTVASVHSGLGIGDSGGSGGEQSGDGYTQFLVFSAVADADPGTIQISSGVVVPAWADGKTLSVNGGCQSLVNGMLATGLSQGDIVVLQLAAPTSTGTAVTCTASVDDDEGSWQVVTKTGVAPNEFTFIDVDDAEPDAFVDSDTVDIGGFVGSLDASVSGVNASLIKNGVPGAASTVVTAGDSLGVRAQASSDREVTVQATVTIGDGTPVVWQIATAADAVPDAFSFTDVTDAEPSSMQTASAVITGISGIKEARATNGAEVSLDGSVFAETVMISADETLWVHMAAPATSGASASTLVSVGNGIASKPWTITAKQLVSIEYLIVGGGAGGGSTYNGGGGGGGVIENSGMLASGIYSVVVGSGSPRQTATYGYSTENGNDSSFNSLIAFGGGGTTAYEGRNGGTGGGGSAGNGWDINAGGLGTSGQGYGGGYGQYFGMGTCWGGGGGGAGSTGGNAAYGSAGIGGNGHLSSISGAPVYYGAGGNGYGSSGGGTGYGDKGSGGAWNADGKPGVVIIRYAGAQKAIGGTVTSLGEYTIHTFTSSGSFELQP